MTEKVSSDIRERAEAFVEASDDLDSVEEVRGHWAKIGYWSDQDGCTTGWQECWYDFSSDPPVMRGSTEPPDLDGVSKCSCCGARPADHTFPGLTEEHRSLNGRPISTQCSVEHGSARVMARRIRDRDAGRVGGEDTPLPAPTETRAGKPMY